MHAILSMDCQICGKKADSFSTVLTVDITVPPSQAMVWESTVIPADMAGQRAG
jgi:hypothetical protein